MFFPVSRLAIVDTVIGGLPDADEVVYASAGCVVDNPCGGPCTESLADGHFVIQWPYQL